MIGHHSARREPFRGNRCPKNLTPTPFPTEEGRFESPSPFRGGVGEGYLEPPIPLIRERNGDREKKVPARVWERLFDKLDVPTEAEAHAVEYQTGP
jgi:hypothetical protein